MTSRHESEINLEGESPLPQERPASASAEAAYDHLTVYGFARRYAKGKVVADIGLEVGHGSRLLAETAESVTGLAASPQAIELALKVYPAPNVSYRRVNLPDLPLTDGSFDLVVAFGVVEQLERPEDLVREARRVLREGGVLLISAVDRQTNTNEHDPGSNDGRREMYVPEFQQMLEHNFGDVQIFRHGAVAGGIVFPATDEVTGARVESARFSLADPNLDVGPPTTRSVVAVCGDAPADEEQPYLLLDSERRVFDEREELAGDVELLRDEIWQMQETEVQAFVDAIKVRKSLIQELPRYLPHMRNILLEHLIHRRNIIRGNIYAIRRKGAMGLARGALRRSSALYWQLRAKTRDSD